MPNDVYKIIPYNRENALAYAHKWAFGRNPKYLKFDNFGGDCTNFISQILYEGSKVMNYTPIYGWYYINSSQRTASWTGVTYLYNFLVNNKSKGPFGEQVEVSRIKQGDVLQLSFKESGPFNHSMVIVSTGDQPSLDNILIATHTYDSDYRPIQSYNYKRIRFIHIGGVRV